MVETNNEGLIAVEVAVSWRFQVTIILKGVPAIQQEFPTMTEALEFASEQGLQFGIGIASIYVGLPVIILNAQLASAEVELAVKGVVLDA